MNDRSYENGTGPAGRGRGRGRIAQATSTVVGLTKVRCELVPIGCVFAFLMELF